MFAVQITLETVLSSLALLIAIGAAVVSCLTLRLEWLKPFELATTLRGVIWMPPVRPDSPLSINLPVVMANRGARRGSVEAAFVRLLPLPALDREFRLEAMVLEDPNVAFQLANAPDHKKADAIRGIGGFLSLGKYEAVEVGFRLTFPPNDALRTRDFDAPDQLTPGRYRLEFWCLTGGKWRLAGHMGEVMLHEQLLRSVAAGKPAINLSGALYDTAPGAPFGPKVE